MAAFLFLTRDTWRWAGGRLPNDAAGVPVFAEGKVRVAVLLGLTGGYLWAYPAAAGVYLAAVRARFRGRWIAIVAGTTLIFLAGGARLAAFAGVHAAVALGVVSFVPADLAKITVASGCRNWWPESGPPAPGGRPRLAGAGRLRAEN